ncbi:DUF485 domain-containing protein [Niallia sp. Krafla_26]|uniref:DUF485 domain-containing protein n=1 Tax=Niallia sp. Krafla_26 TaxID=3064703 RepID=UPI003D18485C
MEHLAKEDVRKKEEHNFDFEKIASSPEFGKLMESKRKFLVPLTGLFLALYFLLPILTSYTTILNKPAIGSVSWTWVYSLGLFIMTWVLCMIYVKKAGQYDQSAKQIIEKYGNEGDHNV